ncbi:hypothetical protein, partial [uncultured Rikenella sp.]|uniref:hypothetical protein n=1 Tax=uncultured Rikenella sp. TaxID=368003 RepID=UPI00261AB55C
KRLQSASLRDALAVSARLVGLDFRRARYDGQNTFKRAHRKNLSPTKQGGENPWSAHRDDLCKSSLRRFLTRKRQFHAGRHSKQTVKSTK